MSNTVNLELSEAEATAAIQLFDLAVKSGGLQVAGIALNLVGKLQKAFNHQPIIPAVIE